MRKSGSSLLAFACLTLGCSVLSPQPDESRFFVLTPVTVEQARVADRLILGVGPIVLPAYLTRPQVVRRSGENRLVFSQEEAWGEPLERALRRVLAEDLGGALGTVEVVQWPWSEAFQVDYEIPVEVLRFEAAQHGAVFLDARWVIRRPRERSLLLARESRVVETPRDPSTDAVVAAMSAAVGRLSVDIAAAIESLEEDRGSRSRGARPESDRQVASPPHGAPGEP